MGMYILAWNFGHGLQLNMVAYVLVNLLQKRKLRRGRRGVRNFEFKRLVPPSLAAPLKGTYCLVLYHYLNNSKDFLILDSK